MRKRRLIMSFLVLASFMLLFSCYTASSNFTLHNIYQGEIINYTVFIEETQKDNQFCRRVYLTGLSNHINPLTITGYNNDYLEKEAWDEIFLTEPHKREGNTKDFMFHNENHLGQPQISYPQMKSSPQPHQMRYAEWKLDQAMKEIYNLKHLVKTL